MRTCPRCQDLNGRDANYCAGCGAMLLTFERMVRDRTASLERERKAKVAK